jgi:hypothetical protein
MPEFILNASSGPGSQGYAQRKAHPYYELSTFAKGYVEAMFFTNGDCGDDKDENSFNDAGVERLTRAAVTNIKRECSDFVGAIMPDGCFMRQWLNSIAEAGIDYDDEQAGRDFWFTRQGHGVGFWDRDVLALDVYRGADTREYVKPGEDAKAPGAEFIGVLGDLLSAAAKKFGDANPYISRGWIHYA